MTHPHWCSPSSCSAYSAELSDLLYHRSAPAVVPTDDDRIKIYIYRSADEDGGNDYVELVELEEPIIEPWYLNQPRYEHDAEISMPTTTARRVQSAMAALALD
jgi:hypothetical protein